MQYDKLRVLDGFTSVERGVNSGQNPSSLGQNQVAYAVNCTMRGGYLAPRPGFKKQTLKFLDCDGIESTDVRDAFQDGQFQVAASYQPRVGDACLITSIAGRVYRINVTPDIVTNNTVVELTGADVNASDRERSWAHQCEDFLVIQDGESAPFFYDGATLRRSATIVDEIPVGNALCYAHGRIWQANGREYIASDIVGGDTGTALYDFRDAILHITENTYLAEGGSFSVPITAGDITGFAPIPTIDTALGEGAIAIFTSGGVWLNDAPMDRTTWKDLNTPLQRVAIPVYGAESDWSIVPVNQDLFYRSHDGIRSLIMAVREFGQWGNTPVSRELQRTLQYDDRKLLGWASAMLFDNRLLMTCAPARVHGHGVAWSGLAVLDFDIVSSMSNKSNPAYDGIWTGIRVLQLVKGRFNGVERGFAFVLNPSDEIELWEITRDEKFDNDDDRITWMVETPSYSYQSPFDIKRLFTGDIWIDQVHDEVDFSLKYKPDQYPNWQDWHDWTEMAPAGIGLGPDPVDDAEQYRTRMRLPQPLYVVDTVNSKPFCDGYEFQFRLEITGYCRVKAARFIAHIQQEEVLPEYRT